jgi:hypothetical protein
MYFVDISVETTIPALRSARVHCPQDIVAIEDGGARKFARRYNHLLDYITTKLRWGFQIYQPLRDVAKAYKFAVVADEPATLLCNYINLLPGLHSR